MGISAPLPSPPNPPLPAGTDILVQGTSSDGDPDTRKVPQIDSVTYAVDGGATASGSLHFHSEAVGFIRHVGYIGSIPALPDGAHVIEVASDFSNGDTVVDSVAVTVGTFTDTNLTGTCTFKSAMHPPSSQVNIPLRFTQSATVDIVGLPITIAFPTGTFEGYPLDVVVTLVSADSGSFSTDGSISIPNVNIDVKAKVSGLPVIGSKTEEGTLATTLTTGPSTSSAFGFNDQGTPLQQPTGLVTLFGDGTYSATIFGMTDGSIGLAGTISPLP